MARAETGRGNTQFANPMIHVLTMYPTGRQGPDFYWSHLPRVGERLYFDDDEGATEMFTVRGVEWMLSSSAVVLLLG
jgi:hypothetical protein